MLLEVGVWRFGSKFAGCYHLLLLLLPIVSNYTVIVIIRFLSLIFVLLVIFKPSSRNPKEGRAAKPGTGLRAGSVTLRESHTSRSQTYHRVYRV